MTDKHTPGPWMVGSSHNVPVNARDIGAPGSCPTVWINRIQGSGTGLCLTFTACEPRERILADADLIAAAPETKRQRDELVAAIEWLLSQTTPIPDKLSSYVENGALARLRDALATDGAS